MAPPERRYSSHICSQTPVVRRRPVSAAAVVISSTATVTSTSHAHCRRPVVIHGGKERPPAPKIIKVAPQRPQSIAAHRMSEPVTITVTASATPVANKQSSSSSQPPLVNARATQPPKLSAPQRRADAVPQTVSAATQTTLPMRKPHIIIGQLKPQTHQVSSTPVKVAVATMTTETAGLVNNSKSAKSAAVNNVSNCVAAACKYFTEDVSVSESTDITDVTAKSHSVNSYSTSMQAEIGSSHFSSTLNAATAAALNAYRYQKHINIDAGSCYFNPLINSSICRQ